MSFQDHFFGKIDSTREGELSLSLAQLLPYARATGPARTTAQVRRFLSRHSHLVLTDFHSAPAFPELLRNLVSEDISLVRLGLRQDLGDDPAQDKTLCCFLVFAEGALLQRLAAVRGRLSLCADQAAAAKWWLSMPMASVSAEGPMPKALSTRRTSPLMPGCRHQGRACPLRRARMTSNPLIVA